MKIKIDLSLAVKINSHSSTRAVDFESGAGKVVKSLLHTTPYYFAVSGYRMYRLSPSKFFKEHKAGVPEDFMIMKEKRGKFRPLVITCQPNDCCLRCSQSCLEQSLFRDHFQGRNMVYGLRAQSPRYDWDQGSEERAQGSEEWDQGSQGFLARIRDQIYYTV